MSYAHKDNILDKVMLMMEYHEKASWKSLLTENLLTYER